MTASGACGPPGPSRKAPGWPLTLRRRDGKAARQRCASASPNFVAETAFSIVRSPEKLGSHRWKWHEAARVCRRPRQRASGRHHLGRDDRVSELTVNLRASLRLPLRPTHAERARELIRAGERQGALHPPTLARMTEFARNRKILGPAHTAQRQQVAVALRFDAERAAAQPYARAVRVGFYARNDVARAQERSRDGPQLLGGGRIAQQRFCR